ncbi:Glycosyltransferase [hydrothermal vent metagenome]|uniref:Glycosyltransferase n=1 Tax=hydrothermal vent metagenome TaxID=652676 RepID=A0A3B1C322_9ZZZZ
MTKKKKNKWESIKTVVFIGNYLPRKCGIATFTTDLSDAIAREAPDTAVWVMAMNDRLEGYNYPPRVRFEISQNNLSEYDLAAEFLNMSHTDVVCLQHEYGIFGGRRGSNIVELLQNLRMPVVTTLHTILNDPPTEERKILNQLADLSDRLVVMSQRAVEFLKEIYNVPEEKIVYIPHGIPDVPFTDPSFYKDKFGVEGKKVILSFGLLSPGKGIENVIDALPAIVEAHPDSVYIVLGATHPNVLAERGEDYRIELQLRAKELGVDDHVAFHNRFVDVDDLCEFLGAADVFVTPYLNEAQITSGVLSYALGTGNAIVSTPYWHAQEMLSEERGRLVPFNDPSALAEQISDLFENETTRHAMRKRAYMFCRKMVWKEVANQYLEVFELAKKERLRVRVPAFKLKTLSVGRTRLPEINLNHLRLMTDDTGILQHAKFTVPNRSHGYCIDDNARALIVAVLAQEVYPKDLSLKALTSTYISFMDHAFNEETGRFRNFMSYDRRWLEDVGSDDSHGRSVWGLGVAVAFCGDKGQLGIAVNLFQRSLSALENLSAPRAIAFSLLGLHAYLRQFSGDTSVRRLREVLARKLMKMFTDNATDDWTWMEDTVTYDNARASHALILSGQWLQDNEMLSMGLASLEWLRKIQTTSEGSFAPIGNNGWYPKGGAMARFDQQPLEACAMIDACIEAFNITRDDDWMSYANKLLNWYLGENDLHLALYDPATGGCRDGLEPQGVNENQGAESTLSWLNSLLVLHSLRGRETVEIMTKKEKIKDSGKA